MTEPFLGQMIFAAFNFPPKGYASANGTLLPINQNQALFSLLGTMYGGNGQTNFALPNLQGCVPVHVGGGIVQGERGGATSVTLSQTQMPAHTHLVQAVNGDGNQAVAADSILAGSQSALYSPSSGALAALNTDTVGPAGSSQAHSNMQPYTVIGAYIAIQGIFPSRN